MHEDHPTRRAGASTGPALPARHQSTACPDGQRRRSHYESVAAHYDNVAAHVAEHYPCLVASAYRLTNLFRELDVALSRLSA